MVSSINVADSMFANAISFLSRYVKEIGNVAGDLFIEAWILGTKMQQRFVLCNLTAHKFQGRLDGGGVGSCNLFN